MTVDDWFDMNDGRNLARVAELFTVNGDQLEVTQAGRQRAVDKEVNRYERIGITFPEALELTYYRGVIDTFVNSSPNPQAAAKAAMGRITREARGELIEIFTAEQLKHLKIWR